MVFSKNYIENKFRNGDLETDFIFYTFWFHASTTALLRIKKRHPIKVLTRVHGQDLFLERNGGYIPFREYDISHIDKVVAVSQNALQYLLVL